MPWAKPVVVDAKPAGEISGVDDLERIINSGCCVFLERLFHRLVHLPIRTVITDYTIYKYIIRLRQHGLAGV